MGVIVDVILAEHRGGYDVRAADADVETVSDAFLGTFTSRDAAAAHVARLEAAHRVRWIWADTQRTYRWLLGHGVSVERATDLRQCHRILRHATATAHSELATASESAWDRSPSSDDDAPPTLLSELDRADDHDWSADALAAEHHRQLRAVAGAANPGALRLLLLAESAGALAAAEMFHVGVPWSAEVHDRQLTDALGPRPPAGQRPLTLQRLADRIRELLGDARLNPDSPTELIRALRRAGLDVRTTRKWELAELDHPVTAPLLEYKQLSRLFSANGWAWLDAWVRDGRFHPDYVPGGVVTGRWATRGSGALQLPKSLRSAVVADPGWRLVVADVAQLEPRMLAAMSGDRAMIAASRGTDLYQGLVDRGIVATRQQAKIGMLGALYGGTTGESGEVLPRLRQAFPVAVELVDAAARAGERFERVSTWLGRSSPEPGRRWVDTQQQAYHDDADERDHRRARSQSRDWGRFTRNFVVQGTAAEWAMCWIATLRRRLRAMSRATGQRPALVYFLHDEIIVHTPAELAADVTTALHDAASEAVRLMFGDDTVDVPLTLDVVGTYADAS